jgi:hypothetical protein
MIKWIHNTFYTWVYDRKVRAVNKFLASKPHWIMGEDIQIVPMQPNFAMYVATSSLGRDTYKFQMAFDVTQSTKRILAMLHKGRSEFKKKMDSVPTNKKMYNSAKEHDEAYHKQTGQPPPGHN